MTDALPGQLQMLTCDLCRKGAETYRCEICGRHSCFDCHDVMVRGINLRECVCRHHGPGEREAWLQARTGAAA